VDSRISPWIAAIFGGRVFHRGIHNDPVSHQPPVIPYGQKNSNELKWRDLQLSTGSLRTDFSD
jgi:hypothetical protein